MSSPNGREITVLRLHTGTHIKAGGGKSIGDIIDTTSNSDKYREVRILKVMGGALIQFKLGELFIPDGNIISAELKPIEKETAPNK